MSCPLPRSSRRSVLHGLVTAAGLAGATALGATGCTTDDPRSDPPSDPTPDPTSSRLPPSTPDGVQDGSSDPDTALVTLLVEEISRTHARVRADRLAHPTLSGPLRRLERLHLRHVAELGGLVEVPPVSAERRRGQVLAEGERLEARLQRRLVRDAVAAESGALALLVAGMAAGLAQERALL